MNVFLIAKEGKQTSQEKESQTRKPELKSQKTSGCLSYQCKSKALKSKKGEAAIPRIQISWFCDGNNQKGAENEFNQSLHSISQVSACGRNLIELGREI